MTEQKEAPSSPEQSESPEGVRRFTKLRRALARYGDVYWWNNKHHLAAFTLNVPAIRKAYCARACYNDDRQVVQITVMLPTVDLTSRDKDTLCRLQEHTLLNRMDFSDVSLCVQCGSVFMGNGDSQTVTAMMIGELRRMISHGDLQMYLHKEG